MSQTPEAPSPQTMMPMIEEVTQISQERMAAISNRLNNAAIMDAIQKGYAMACEDHGLPVPEFPDPSEVWGL